jgi:hypothetical protein
MRSVRAVALLVAVAALVLGTAQAGASPRGTDGQITYDNQNGVVTANPDGSHVNLVVPGTCCGGWSSDGSKLAVPYGTADGRIGPAIVNADGTGYTPFPIDDPTLNIGCGTGSWSPDGKLLACETWDDTTRPRLLETASTRSRPPAEPA